MFTLDALNPGVKKREVFGWAMYDFANSGYTTVVLTAVYAAYFVGGIAQGASWATFAWTLALSISYALVMVTAPALGALADRLGAKKRFLLLATLGCVLSTLALAVPGPGQVVLAAVLIIASNTCFSYGESLSAAFLPELAKRDALGKVSGWGWSFGYFGGMLALGICLGYGIYAQQRGWPATHFVPATMVVTAALFGVSACVTFALLKERAGTAVVGSIDVKASMAQLRTTFSALARCPDFKQLLVCAVFYQGGVAVTITLAAIYAEQVIGFKQQETMALIFALNLAAALGAFCFGYFQDKIGHKRALAITLVGWIITCLIAASATTKGVFWVAAGLAGVCMGSSQSAGRAMAGLFAPQFRLAEFFGLWTFATRLASIIGPLTYGAIAWATGGNHRLAIVSTTLLFLAGLWALRGVDVERGRAAVA